jgi:hypothetical protein
MILLATIAGLLVATCTVAAGVPLPVKDARGAIAIAKQVCGKLALPVHNWGAVREGDVWEVRALPRATGYYGLDVTVPVRGAAPKLCIQTLVQLLPAPQR